MPFAHNKKRAIDTVLEEVSDERVGRMSFKQLLDLAEASHSQGTAEALEEKGRDDRINACATDLMLFAQWYFPHYTVLPSSTLHKDLAKELRRVSESPDSERLAIAAPRGNAKSTWVSLIFVLWQVVYGRKHFVVLISNTSDVAEQLLKDVRTELEDNPRLREDFPHACGKGPVWQVTSFITNNDVKFLALGGGKKIRGRRHKQHRPDLLILDDLESDESCRNPDQRNKMWDWLMKAVLKAKGVGVKSDVIAIGTLLHFDSVLARILDPRKSPGWRSKVYSSVITFSPNKRLWDQWEALYTDWRLPDYERQSNALAFFTLHEEEMLFGTEVLWPEGESYLDLMKLRLEDGELAFLTEKQNQPVDQSQCTFPEEWFKWGEEVTVTGRHYFKPDGQDPIPLEECDLFGAIDPSLGKLDKHSDPSAIITLAAWPSYRLSGGEKYRLFICLDADIARRHPQSIIDRTLVLYKQRSWQKVGIEITQFQEMFAEWVERAIANDRDLQALTIVKMKPLTDKKLRIQKLSPFIQRGQLIFARSLVALYEQLRYFPMSTHDDGPDCLEMAMEVLGAIGWQFLGPEYLTPPPGEEAPPAKSPYQEQLERVYPYAFEPPPSESPCGTCAHRLERGPLKRDLCEVHLWTVDKTTMGCSWHEPVEAESTPLLEPPPQPTTSS